MQIQGSGTFYLSRQKTPVFKSACPQVCLIFDLWWSGFVSMALAFHSIVRCIARTASAKFNAPVKLPAYRFQPRTIEAATIHLELNLCFNFKISDSV